jgi:hypothetical protein
VRLTIKVKVVLEKDVKNHFINLKNGWSAAGFRINEATTEMRIRGESPILPAISITQILFRASDSWKEAEIVPGMEEMRREISLRQAGVRRRKG